MRSQFARLVPALGLCATLTAPLAARAEEGDEPYPQVYGQRPITLDEGQFVATGVFEFLKPGKGADMEISLLGSVDYGVMKNLTVGALAVPLGLSPETNYGNPEAYVRYRFLRGATPVELGVDLRARFPVEDGSKFGLAPGLVGSWEINDAAKLEFGVYLPLTFSDPIAKELYVPISLAISFTRNIFFEVGTGLDLPDFDGDLLMIPLEVQVGYTLPKNDESPLADIFLGFGFPGFLGPTINSDLTTSTGVNTDTWQFQIGGRLFL